jgi:transcription regulator MmyB-like protein
VDEALRGERPGDAAELAKFLRVRREHSSPADFGISASRSRRTPGLRREEVAFLANIGVKWYASLESGDETHPSPKTLGAIGKALRLSRMDTDYMFSLAGFSAPADRAVDYSFDIPPLVECLINSVHGAAAAVWDLFQTPLCWNGIFDAIVGCSRFSSPLERNLLVQAFGESGFLQGMTGSDFPKLITAAVGMFRRYYSSGEPTPFARQVYDRIKDSPAFRELWESRTVDDELRPGTPVVREHPTIGTITMHTLDSYLHHREGIVLKFWFPADEQTAMKFNRLEEQAAARSEVVALNASRMMPK